MNISIDQERPKLTVNLPAVRVSEDDEAKYRAALVHDRRSHPDLIRAVVAALVEHHERGDELIRPPSFRPALRTDDN